MLVGVFGGEAMRSVRAEGKVTDSLALCEGNPIVVLERQRFVDGPLVGYEIRFRGDGYQMVVEFTSAPPGRSPGA
jgi:DNA-binding GntR family transcriptional regulator